MLRVRQIAEPSRGETFFHRLDPRVKVFLLLFVATVTITIDSPATLLGLFLLSVAATASARLSIDRIKVIAGMVTLTVWGTMLSQAIFYGQFPRTVALTIIPKGLPILGTLTGGIYLYREGFLYGAVQSLRFSTAMCFGLLVCWTTDPRDLLLGLKRLRVPYGLSFMTVTALRFIPVIIAEAATVLAAARLRAFRPFRVGLRSMGAAWLSILRPIFGNCLRRASTLALSVQSRAFDPTQPRTDFHQIRFRAADYVLLVSMWVALAGILGAKLLYGLYVSEVYYTAELRPLYEFVRHFL
ncbi:MAG: energy-coupling factor transporter transmembrane protein EcfT [Planctomycetes bacterium]|nr:energy-coupling factor transporter transmembrane protein EcfT [Planctomycetota bacterium]